MPSREGLYQSMVVLPLASSSVGSSTTRSLASSAWPCSTTSIVLRLGRLALEREELAAGVVERIARRLAAAHHLEQLVLDGRALRQRVDHPARERVLLGDPGGDLLRAGLFEPAVVFADRGAVVVVLHRALRRIGVDERPSERGTCGTDQTHRQKGALPRLHGCPWCVDKVAGIIVSRAGESKCLAGCAHHERVGHAAVFFAVTPPARSSESDTGAGVARGVGAGRARCGGHAAHPVERRGAAGGRPGQLDHLQRRQRPRRARRLRRGDARLLRGRRADDRFVADVRLVAGRHRRRAGARSARASRGSSPPTRCGSRRAARGPAQIEASRRLWGVPRFDLLQVHNLLAWEAHLPTLLAMKAAGQLRYVGITTSEGRRHREIEAMMRKPADRLRAADLQPARPRGRGSACCRWRASAASR